MFDSREVVRLYRGWDKLERKLLNGQPRLIDFDLVPSQDSDEFESRIQVLNRLMELRDALLPESESAEEQFIWAKLNASVHYLRVLMGEQIPFGEYIRATVGIEPRFYTVEEIDEAKERVEALLDKFGFKLEPSYRCKFEETFTIHDPEMVKDEILEKWPLWFNRLMEYIGNVELPDIEIVFKNVDAYWHSWVSGSDKGISLQINLHERVNFPRGYPEILTFHELCGHAVQAAFWLFQIRNGKMPKAFGITTIHTPEQFMAEGIGQALSEIIASDDELSLEAVLSRELEKYRFRVYNNAHLMINSGGTIREIYRYVAEHLPFERGETIEAELRDRSRNPLFRTYQYVYALSGDFFRNVTRGLSYEQKRAFLRRMYSTMMTPRQIEQFVSEKLGKLPVMVTATSTSSD